MHLSDLHLGKSILEQSLIEDQKYILDKIVEIIVEKDIDVVLIAGDIYDKSVPSSEAVRLFSSFLSKMYRLEVKIFVISGNHDSKDRLSFGNELFVDNGVYIEGIFSGKLANIKLDDAYGEVFIYMLPFVKPVDVRGYYPNEEISSYHDAIATIINNTDIDSSKRNIIMVHQFVTANGIEVERSDSETISLGGVDNIDVSLFDKFDYVALGHIHRGQQLIRETVRYSGSPLKYSFSEVYHKKSVPIIEIKEKGNINIEFIDLVPIRDMRIIKGRISDLLSADVVNMGNVDDYISAIITDDDYIMDAIGKLRVIYKNILKLDYHNNRTLGVNVDNFDNLDVQKLSEIELFSNFYMMQNNIPMDDKREEIVNKVIKECLEEEL